jgi:hypothetical protein
MRTAGTAVPMRAREGRPVTYRPDLSAYDHLPRTLPRAVTARNVGWLARWRRHRRGEAPSPFVAALGELVRDEPRARTRGAHPCHRCGASGPTGLPVEIGGRRVLLGSAEVRVIAADGSWLIAPDLVYHYVTAHRYLPPEAFIEAVTARRVAPTAD